MFNCEICGRQATDSLRHTCPKKTLARIEKEERNPPEEPVMDRLLEIQDLEESDLEAME